MLPSTRLVCRSRLNACVHSLNAEITENAFLFWKVNRSLGSPGNKTTERQVFDWASCFAEEIAGL